MTNDLSPAAPDVFDLASIRLSQTFVDDVSTEVLMTTLEVRKPKNAEFFRVNPDTNYRLELGVINVEEDRSTYLVLGGMHDELSADLTPVLLVVAVNRSGTSFLWPLKMTKAGGRPSPWNETARAAANAAETAWVRMDSNTAKGHYIVRRAIGELGAPVFPHSSMNELVRAGFSDRIISSVDHPVVRRLRGEI